jgi:hypothetical protein
LVESRIGADPEGSRRFDEDGGDPVVGQRIGVGRVVAPVGEFLGLGVEAVKPRIGADPENAVAGGFDVPDPVVAYALGVLRIMAIGFGLARLGIEADQTAGTGAKP